MRGGIIVSVRRAEPTEVEACSPLTLLTIHQKYKDIIRYMKIKTITIHRRKISQKTITPIALLKKSKEDMMQSSFPHIYMETP